MKVSKLHIIANELISSFICYCICLGNAMLLNYDETWRKLLLYYGKRGCKVSSSNFPPKQH